MQMCAPQGEQAPDWQFATLTSHGSGKRLALRHGTVVLSELPSGASEIRALAPCVKYVVEGEEVYRIDGRTHRLGKGEFMLVEAGSDFEVRTARSGPTVGLCVYLGVSGARSPLAAQDGLGALVLRGSSAHPIAALLERHARRLIRSRSAGEAETRRLIAEVSEAATLYLSDFRTGVDRLGSAKLSTRVETLQRLDRARGFIHAHGRSTRSPRPPPCRASTSPAASPKPMACRRSPITARSGSTPPPTASAAAMPRRPSCRKSSATPR
jgi:hypothetical protein